MRHVRKIVLALAACCMAAATLLAQDPIPSRNGTIEDLQGLPPDKNLAAGAFATMPIVLDASALPEARHLAAVSGQIALKRDTRYTLAIRYRASGKSILTVGVQWDDPDRPDGLAGMDDLRAAFPATSDTALRVFTFQSDPKLPQTRILLKAWGGMRAEIESILLVEGWYVD